MVLKKLKNKNEINYSIIYSLSSKRYLLSSYFLNPNDTSLLINKFNKYSVLNYKSLSSFHHILFPLLNSFSFVFRRKLLIVRLYKYVLITDKSISNLLFPFVGSLFTIQFKFKKASFFGNRLFKYNTFRFLFRRSVKYTFKRFNTIRNSYDCIRTSSSFLELSYSFSGYCHNILFNDYIPQNSLHYSKFYLSSSLDNLYVDNVCTTSLCYLVSLPKFLKCAYSPLSYFHFLNFFKQFDVSVSDYFYSYLFSWFNKMHNHSYKRNFNSFIDIFFKSSIFEKMIGLLVKKGFKEKSENVFFRTLFLIKDRFNFNPFYFFMIVFNNIYYLFDLKKVKAYGKMQTIPILISGKKSFFLSMKLLFSSIRSKKNYISFEERFLDVLYNCFRKEGSVYEQYKTYIQLCKNNQFLINYFIK